MEAFFISDINSFLKGKFAGNNKQVKIKFCEIIKMKMQMLLFHGGEEYTALLDNSIRG